MQVISCATSVSGMGSSSGSAVMGRSSRNGRTVCFMGGFCSITMSSVTISSLGSSPSFSGTYVVVAVSGCSISPLEKVTKEMGFCPATMQEVVRRSHAGRLAVRRCYFIATEADSSTTAFRGAPAAITAVPTVHAIAEA